VILAGARLITLSIQAHAAQLRIAAQSAAVLHARQIEAQLQALLERAQAEARRAARVLGEGTRASAPVAVLPEKDVFWMNGTDVLVRARATDPAVSQALASEVSTPGAGSAPAALLGPVRYGSEWFVAAQAVISLPQTQARAATSAWKSVAYESLDALLLHAHFGRLVNEGYDFELSQLDPLTHTERVFFASRPRSPTEAVASGVGLPGAAAGPARSAYLDLAIRPRRGWYPAADITAEIGLLAVLAWALAFGTYDLTCGLRRTQAALTSTRKRLHLVNQRLVAEIEEHQSLQKSLEHARYHDSFSGLPNRRYFMDQLDRALRELRSGRRELVAIILIDIDRFKLINETLGQTAGDELILQVAQQFATALEGLECVLARWGGGQLAVLALELDSVAAAQGIVTLLLNVHPEPFALRRHQVKIAARIGFSCIDSGLQRAEEALREAEIALSVAQRQSARAVVYTPGMSGAAVSLVSLEADLHIALERREFRLLFQPIYDLRGRRVVGAEALLRWRHPVEGQLTPDKFLTICEEAGVIVPVTRWIIQRVCRLAAEWRQRLPQGVDFFLSVNLSPAVLRDPALRQYVANVLRETGVPPKHLKFELTEGGLINNVSPAREVLEGLHSMGVELMLDDFGTGYSSLSYLQLFPFDYVKIDRPFANQTGPDRTAVAVTSAILQMSKSLGLRTVAECVETHAAAHALVRLGCDFGQGNFFSAPLEPEEALDQLRAHGAQATIATTMPNPPGQTGTGDTGLHSPTIVLADELQLHGDSADETPTLKQSKSGC
jgi:diguanylate cyclase (GGDEF)-like protein